MRLKYIGKGMRGGPERGKVYQCTVTTCGDEIWVIWSRTKQLYYLSLREMCGDWEDEDT